MKRRLGAGLASIGLVLAISMGVAPAGAADTTSLTVGSLTKTGGLIAVSGSLALGTDALSAVTVGTDGAGDATPPNAGLDIGNLTVTPNLTSKTLKFSLELKDGSAAGGVAPASGVGVPVVVNGEDHTWWLGGGNAGSNLGKTGKWTGLCTNEDATGARGGWDCTRALTGAMDGTHVEWTLAFSKVTPTITPGSTIDLSGAGAASVPESFLWPVGAAGDTLGVDSASTYFQYLVPGGIQIAVRPAGVTPTEDDFVGTGTFTASSGAYNGTITAPTASGTYTVTVRSCFGTGENPTCVTGSQNITV
ncbi:MAG: hypothetical protein ABR600_14000 [Actinomycetota bacterium]